MLATSPGVIKSWSWFTEFPIFPDFQLVKHIPSICGQSLLIGLVSDLLKNAYSITRPYYPNQQLLTTLIYNSHAILDKIFRNYPAIRTQFSADNSHPIITWQLLVMVTLKQCDAIVPTLIIVESIKTTSIEYVNTRVFEKIKNI